MEQPEKQSGDREQHVLGELGIRVVLQVVAKRSGNEIPSDNATRWLIRTLNRKLL